MIEINNVTFSYNVDGEGDFSSDRGNAGDEGNSLHNISLTIPDGQVVVLCGESGCGKTTLTRLINGLIPHYFDGALQGNVLIDGRDVSSQPLYDTARQVGSVFQNPRSQFFNVDTTSEISFGCENLGMPREEILTRLGETVSALHIEKLLNRSLFNLSGGEKQKIACAGAFIMQPRVFVLDEPSSNLDADSILDLRDLLAYLKSLGKTIVLSEHRLYYLREIADRYVYLKDGSLAGDFTAEEFQKLPEERRREMGLRTGNLNTLSMGGAGSLDAGAAAASLGAGTAAQTVLLKDFCFSYKNAAETLHIPSCEIPRSGIIGIIGHNGAGKSTFSRCFCGLEKRCGTVVADGKIHRPKDRLNECYMVMQDVGHQLFTESVLDEVLISMPREDEAAAREILEQLELSALAQRHPASLSGGQKQRLAIASAIASNRPVIFLDEPTSGLDCKHMLQVAGLLKRLYAEGKTVYVITHDPELICECCTHIIHLEAGAVKEWYPLEFGKIRDFFTSK